MAPVEATSTVVPMLIPAVAVLVGSAVGLGITPGKTVRAGCQHLAAGIVLGAVAVELVPPLIDTPHWLAVCTGFAIGLAVMLVLDRVLGGASGEGASGSMVAGLVVDLFIDGLLIGLALEAGARGGWVLAGAVSFETFFIGLAVAAMFARRRRTLASLGLALAVALVAGTFTGLEVAQVLTGAWHVGVLAFGCAALTYLVTEELLAEAHEGDPEPAWVTVLFFIGFGATLTVAAAG